MTRLFALINRGISVSSPTTFGPSVFAWMDSEYLHVLSRNA